MATIRPDLIGRFFTDLYGDSFDDVSDAALVLWSSKDTRSHWMCGIEEAVEVSGKLSTASDLYFGVSLQHQPSALEERSKRTGRPPSPAALPYCRGYASTALVVPGVWLDVDIAGEAHEKLNLPPTHEAAWAIVEKMPLPPSVKVTTGGGFHLYWLFKEPFHIESEKEGMEIASYIKGWQQLAINLAKGEGYMMDSTHDLPRILRPAGTINFKYDFEVSYDYCEPMIVGNDGPEPNRYNPSDFEGFAVEVTLPQAVVLIPGLEGLNADSSPPANKLSAMLNLVPQFMLTWNRQRKDFPSGKNSQSEYDMSLANMAARNGWSKLEVAALILKHRRDGGEPLKLDRPDYYSMLVEKAQSSMAAQESLERIEDRVDAISYGASSTEDEKPGMLTDLKALLGIPLVSIIKYVSDPPQYRLILEEGPIHLGGVDNIINSSKFRAAIAAISGRLIPRFKGDQWDPVAQAILNAVEEQDLGADSSAEGLVLEWVTEYLTSHRPSDERMDAIQIREPFIDPDGRAAFFLSQFKTWLSFHRDEKLTRRQLATMLRTAGLTPRTQSFRRAVDGMSSSVHVWSVTESIQSRVPGLHKEVQAELPQYE